MYRAPRSMMVHHTLNHFYTQQNDNPNNIIKEPLYIIILLTTFVPRERGVVIAYICPYVSTMQQTEHLPWDH